MRRILCLWLPDWPVQRLQLDRPDLGDRMIMLHTRHAQRGLCVSACCLRSRERGVAIGMPLGEAQSLVRRGERSERSVNTNASAPADWHTEPHDRLGDLAALRELAWECERHSPLVGIEDAEHPDCLLVEATHLQKRGTPESVWLDDLLEDFASRGLHVRAGLADTVGIAWALAHFAVSKSGRAPIARPGLELPELSPFPLAALRVDALTLDLLAQLGVTTIGALLALPRDGLAPRFGMEILRRLDQARGQEPEVFNAHRPTPPWKERRPLEYPTGARDILHHVLRELLSALSKGLKASEMGVMELSCRFDGREKPSTAVRVALFRPTVDADHLFQLLELQLERLTFPEPIEEVSIEALRTARLEEHQGEFWHTTRSPSDSPRLRGMIERMSSRLGARAVVRVRLVADAQPEMGFVCEPLTNVARQVAASRRKSKVSRKKSAAGEEAGIAPQSAWRVLERPLSLLTPPASIEVTALEGSPIRFRWQSAWRTIHRCWGPERIDVGWNRGPSVRRNYFRVETDEGEWFWLFQDRLTGQWNLHGAFA